MCGIHALIEFEGDGITTIQDMMHATEHRGPDFTAFCQVTETVFLAANRLKINDLSNASNQPIWTDDRLAVLVWNGEIYNSNELRQTLFILGYEFHSGSDSEVLLYWLKEFGTERLIEIKGMYAFVFTDLIKKQVVVSRDISGEKPLYYFRKGNFWSFSSETKGILAGMPDKPKIDSEQFLPYFYYRSSISDKSFFESVQQVLPGEVLVLDLKGKEVEKKKLSIITSSNSNPNNAQSVFEKKLSDVVLACFTAEVPVGMVLSGGADSSLLYGVWYELTGQALPTYTVTPEESLRNKYSDGRFVEVLSQKYPCARREIVINQEKVMANWDEYVASMDQPIGDSSGFLTWVLAREAKEEVKVLVSGAGADELFGGYNRHKAFKQYLKHPEMMSKIAVLKSKSWLPRNWQKLLQSISANPQDTFIQMAAVEKIPTDYLDVFRSWYPQSGLEFKDALDWDRTFYLTNDILKLHDNACMAHGIEGRAPYLHHDLLEFALRLSESEAMETVGKSMIMTSLKNRGLQAIANRKKLGFGLPLQEWMADSLFREWVFGPIREMAKTWGGNFHAEMLNFALHPEKADRNQFLLVWNMFILASWLKQNTK